MAETGFRLGSPKLTLAGRAIAPKVSFLATPRTHTGGPQAVHADALEILPRRTSEWQVSGDESEALFGSTRLGADFETGSTDSGCRTLNLAAPHDEVPRIPVDVAPRILRPSRVRASEIGSM